MDFLSSHAQPLFTGPPPELVIFHGGNFSKPAAHDWRRVTRAKEVFFERGSPCPNVCPYIIVELAVDGSIIDPKLRIHSKASSNKHVPASRQRPNSKEVNRNPADLRTLSHSPNRKYKHPPKSP